MRRKLANLKLGNLASASPKFIGVDLKQYLPGGNMDPYNRRVAGFTGTGRPADLCWPNEDMFAKITKRIAILCSTDRLVGCH
jgi:hypothetical protein